MDLHPLCPSPRGATSPQAGPHCLWACCPAAKLGRGKLGPACAFLIWVPLCSHLLLGSLQKVNCWWDLFQISQYFQKPSRYKKPNCVILASLGKQVKKETIGLDHFTLKAKNRANPSMDLRPKKSHIKSKQKFLKIFENTVVAIKIAFHTKLINKHISGAGSETDALPVGNIPSIARNFVLFL